MVSKEVIISSKSGLESKMAARLIQKASAYDANIWVQKEERKANAKSLLGLLSLGIVPGETVLLMAEGRDEENAIEELVAFTHRGMTD